jgi:hypothetical protein
MTIVDEKDQIGCFDSDLDRLIQRYGDEFDMSLAAMVGTIQIKIHELVANSIDQDDEEEDDDLPTGYIYVLRSRSEHPFVAQNRQVLHKIGVTGADVKRRVANARKNPTYLLADVEIVGTFKLANINRRKLEALLHKFFAEARLDLELKDRFGQAVEPREWFLVPLPVIEESIDLLVKGLIGMFRYDPTTGLIVKR